MLESFLPFIVIGITTGSVYGLAATGLVLTYKTSGIFNFAYGSVATISIFVFYSLRVEHGWPWPLAALVCVGVLGPIEGLLLERLARALDTASTEVRIVATVGLMLIVFGTGTLWYRNNTALVPQFLPTESFRLLGVSVGWDQVIVTVVSIVLTVILYLFFRFVRMGIAMRGVVDNSSLLSLTGESPARVRRWAWLIGSVFASLAGLMLAPSLNLDAFMITMLVVQALGAAAIGYFSSLPLTFLGGLVIGIGGSLATKYAAQVPSLAGLPSSLPFAVLILALVLTPRARLVQRRLVAERVARPPYHAPVRVRSVFGLVVVGVLMLVPVLAGTYLSVWSNFLIETLLLLSLGVLVRMSGQISLCQYAFAAIGASTFSHLATSAHLPWALALLLAALISIPVGAVVSIPAIRLSGVFLALATLGFGIFVEQMLYNTSFMFGSLTNGIAAPRPNVSLGSWQLSSDKGFYYLVLLIVAVLTVLVVLVQHARLGRLLRALSDSPIGLEAFGTSTNVTKAVVFCLSAVLASLAGALLAMLLHFSVGSNYVSFNSLTLLAVVVIATVGGPWYAVLGGLGLVVLPGYWTSPNASTYLEIAAGAAAVIFALQPDRVPRVPERLAALIDRLGGRRAATATASAAAPPRPAALRPVAERSPAGDGLRVSGLTVRFGGITAVRDAGLHAPMNAITGLVGPNGAGKTTIFNACSGLIRASSGRIELHGRTVTRTSAPARARLGLGRTFQKPQLFESLTVMENVALGREAGLAGANPFRQIASSRAERLSVGAAVDDALYSVGIAGLAGRPVALLSLGQKRLVELARVVAGGFDVLLLDEPSSGLDPVETEAFGEVLTRIVAERGLGLLLVEHDMELVTRICRDVFVLDFGSIIFQGTTEEMTCSSVVRTAYLGEHDAALDAAASQAGVAEPWAEPAPATAVLDSDSVEVGR